MLTFANLRLTFVLSSSMVLVVVDFYHAGPGVINQALILIKSLPVKFRADVFHVGWPAAPGGQMADTGE